MGIRANLKRDGMDGVRQSATEARCFQSRQKTGAALLKSGSTGDDQFIERRKGHRIELLAADNAAGEHGKPRDPAVGHAASAPVAHPALADAETLGELRDATGELDGQVESGALLRAVGGQGNAGLVKGHRMHGGIITDRDKGINRIPDGANITIRELSRPMDKQTVGANIAKYRAEAGFTQESLAASLGYKGASRLGNYETGRNAPPIEELVAIAHKVHRTVDDLLTENNDGAETRRVAHGTIPGSLSGHTLMERLQGFDKHVGQDRIAIPDFVLRRRAPRTDYDAVRWIINPTTAMSPRIPKDALVLVDTGHSHLDQVVDGETYAIRLWGRPDIRRIYILNEDTIRLVGDREADIRTELHRVDFSKLEIGGLVIDAI